MDCQKIIDRQYNSILYNLVGKNKAIKTYSRSNFNNKQDPKNKVKNKLGK